MDLGTEGLDLSSEKETGFVIGVGRGLDWGLEDLREWMGCRGRCRAIWEGSGLWRTYGRLAWKVALVEAARP